MQDKFKSLPLGLPLTLASIGTVATLVAGKRFHAGFGAVWTVLSLWHGWQHRKKMQADVCRIPWCKKAGDPEENTLAALVDSFQVDAYVPGRVRLRSSLLAANPQWQQPLEEYIKSFAGVTDACINILTGSLLITYDGDKLKPKIAALEQQLAEQAAKRI
jgi:hypothetical protein